MKNAETIPMIFLPGLNGDPRVFQPQIAAYPQIHIAEWLEPIESEGIRKYAKRMASTIDCGQACLIAGVSFGGIIAMEMSQYIDARVCLVIASSPDPKTLPAPLRIGRRLAAMLPPSVVGWGTRVGWSTASTAVPCARRKIRRLSENQVRFQRWAIKSLLTWKRPVAAVPASCKILQIHGDRDLQFPLARSTADQVVEGAGHMLTLTHGDDVNAFIAQALKDIPAAGVS